jgi:hypothetical protein
MVAMYGISGLLPATRIKFYGQSRQKSETSSVPLSIGDISAIGCEDGIKYHGKRA